MFGLFESDGFLGIDCGAEYKLAEAENNSFVTKRTKELTKDIIKNFNSKKTATAVSSKQVEIRFVDVADNLSAEEIENMIELEFTRDDLVIQYEVVDFFEQKYAIAFAVEENLVQDKFDNLKEIGLKPRVIETEFHANLRYLVQQNSGLNETVSLVDVGREKTDLIVIKEQELIFARNFAFGGDSITERLTKLNEISLAEAEEYKMAGLDQEELKIVLEELRSQIYNSIDYLQSKYREQVSKIFVTGGSSKLKGIKEYLENQIGLPVEKIDDADLSVAKGLSLREEK